MTDTGSEGVTNYVTQPSTQMLTLVSQIKDLEVKANAKQNEICELQNRVIIANNELKQINLTLVVLRNLSEKIRGAIQTLQTGR